MKVSFADVRLTVLGFVLGLLILSLVGCATPPVHVPLVAARPVEVRIPVAAPCVRLADLPATPQLAPDAQLAQLPDYELVLTLEQHRRELRAWHARASALLSACAGDKPARAALTAIVPLQSTTQGARQ
ncbi:MAG: hypothetical protein ACREBN_10585 [Burkholderiaceae bacterium]